MQSLRAQNLNPSPTAEISKKAKDLKMQGKSIISFGIGEPNFNIPEPIKKTAIKAIEDNFSRYTSSDGMLELKMAIAKKLQRENGIFYNPENIIISTGAKQSIFGSIQTIINPGDEVIVPSPYWVSYPEIIKLAGGVAKFVDIGKEFKLKAEAIEENINSKTKAIILNSPNNPTGSIISKGELLKIGQLAVKHNLYIISDEVYEYFIYNGEHTSIASLGEDIKERTITINGFSKSFGMTGWRLGYAVGPEDIIFGMKKIQDQITSAPCSIVQKSAITALEVGKSVIKDQIDRIRTNRDYVVHFLNEAGFKVNAPEGSFYIFLDISSLKLKGSIEGSVELSMKLLMEEGIVVIPGASFGNDSYIRLSYAMDMGQLEDGLERIASFLKTGGENETVGESAQVK